LFLREKMYVNLPFTHIFKEGRTGMFKKWKEKSNTVKKENYPVRSVSIHELRQAVENFAKQLKDGIHLSIIIKDDLTIDYELLGPYLKAIPEETYYMSKETYEIFPEEK